MVSDIDTSREQALNFLVENRVGVLATADANGRPHASTIYVVNDRTLNFYFVTKRATQKARNLAVNPYASIALYDAQSQTTLQIDGEVTEVTDMRESNGIFTEIQNIARHSSSSGVPPVTELSAGAYVTYRLTAPSLRMASFGKTAADASEPFHIVY